MLNNNLNIIKTNKWTTKKQSIIVQCYLLKYFFGNNGYFYIFENNTKICFIKVKKVSPMVYDFILFWKFGSVLKIDININYFRWIWCWSFDSTHTALSSLFALFLPFMSTEFVFIHKWFYFLSFVISFINIAIPWIIFW